MLSSTKIGKYGTRGILVYRYYIAYQTTKWTSNHDESGKEKDTVTVRGETINVIF